MIVIHKADSRGFANHGWLKTFHTFSFAGYYDPKRINFGALRVLNDDTISGGMGFGTHPHDNMEIITVPLEGDLEHKDSMGNTSVIRSGDIQVMSAGSGIRHSEYNHNQDKPCKLLQIWIFPNKKNVTPRYQQITLETAQRNNRLQQILSPMHDDDGVWIYQSAWFHIGRFSNGNSFDYKLKNSENGIYAFIIEGKFEFEEQILEQRDGIGITEMDNISFKSLENNSEILLMEVPMRV